MDIRFVGVLLVSTLCSFPVFANSLQDFAAQCDNEIGVTVPEFDCDAGTTVPTTINGNPFTINGQSPDHFVGAFTPPATCDRPNVLNSECDPGSKFQVLVNNPEVFVVAHCRRIGNVKSVYGDIAVIQHNKTTGGTCFYQSDTSGIGEAGTTPNNLVGAPSTGVSVMKAATSCLECHDNGPLIRSPYLAQMKSGKDVLPGVGDNTYNKNQPYYVVGEAYKTYSVTTGSQPNACVNCHTLSMGHFGNNVFTRNSAGHLATTSTEKFQAAKTQNDPVNAPMWMTPGQASFSQVNADAAKAIVNCANTFTDIAAPPNTPTCKVTEKLGRVVKHLSLVNANGKCLALRKSDFDANLTTNGVVRSENCDAAALNQKWKHDVDKQQIFVLNGSVKRCLNVGSSISDGMSVFTTPCNEDNPRQKWSTNVSGQVLNKGINDVASLAKCLDVTSTAAQLWSCSTSRAQKWAMQDLRYQNIENVADTSKSINLEADVLTASAINPALAKSTWSIERVETQVITTAPQRIEVYYRIRNRFYTNEFLNIVSGALTNSTITPDLLSAQWIIRNRPEQGQNVFTIQNRADPSRYITLLNGVLQSGAVSDLEPNARWKFKLAPLIRWWVKRCCVFG